MTRWDMGKATLGQSGNRDISRSRCSIRVCTFMHLGVKGSKQRSRDIIVTNEIDNYISRQNIL